MGFAKYSLVLAVMIGLSAVSVQHFAPGVVDQVLSHPLVHEWTVTTHKFVALTQTRLTEAGYPYYLSMVELLRPLLQYVKPGNKSTMATDRISAGAHMASKMHRSEDRMFTVEELKKYDGKKGSKGLYLALMGRVFNVKKGKQHYGPGGGYEFFAGRDASRAFVSGDFSDDGLTDDIRGLSYQDYLGLADWLVFYHNDYKYVGKLAGRYYSENGEETAYARQAERWLAAAEENKDAEAHEKKLFPPCNSEWSPEHGSRVWCTTKSGGVERHWTGVPRQLFTPGKTKPRCACVKNTGAPSNDLVKDLDKDSVASEQQGDLAHPNLKEYDGCPPTETFCVIGKD